MPALTLLQRGTLDGRDALSPDAILSSCSHGSGKSQIRSSTGRGGVSASLTVLRRTYDELGHVDDDVPCGPSTAQSRSRVI